MDKPTPAQMREMGFSADAEPHRMSELAWLAFCAWLNVPPEKVPPMQRWGPKSTTAAWERVAKAVLQEVLADA